MIRPAARAGQDVVYVHNAEGEVRMASDTHAFLHSVKAVSVRPVVGEVP